MKNHYYIKHVLILCILLVLASTRILLAEEAVTPAEEASIPGESPQSEGSFLDTSETEKSFTGQAFSPGITRAIQSTAIVIILIVGTVYFLRKKFGITKAGGKKHMHVVESVPVGAKRFLLLVKIPGKLLVVGMANDHINPLSEITDKEVVDSVSPPSDSPKTGDFTSLMKRVYPEKRQVQAVVSENNH